MKWYNVGEIGDALDLIVESFLEGFLDNTGFAEEMTRLGLSIEEQLDVIREQIDIHETALLATNGSETVH
ncbi:MAG: hypothetical protein ACPH54_07785 [Candidatus Poseidoniaceae archaeon]